MKLLLTLLLLLPVAGFAFESTIEGKVISVTDGDTIKVKIYQNKVEKIRLALSGE
ncbi:MAG: hypothetical protein GQ549_07995 [Gammaproteobacteria bacterium]|jgi:endonuclease YncB( thermonuclease family)|nr:hypothetical protein [Gammaproteobacteria bacterium]